MTSLPVSPSSPACNQFTEEMTSKPVSPSSHGYTKFAKAHPVVATKEMTSQPVSHCSKSYMNISRMEKGRQTVPPDRQANPTPIPEPSPVHSQPC